MLSPPAVALLLSLFGLVSAGYKIDDADLLNRDKYPLEVLAQEAPGHRTWIAIDAVANKTVYSQIAILETAGGQFIFAKVIDGQPCVEFYHRHFEWDSKCDNEKHKYSLFAEDFYGYKRVNLFDYIDGGGCSIKIGKTEKKVDAIGFKNKNNKNIQYLLMAVKSNMRDQTSAKLIGTYDTQSKAFSALALELNNDDFDTYHQQFVTDEARRKFDKKKFEVFCPKFHSYGPGTSETSGKKKTK